MKKRLFLIIYFTICSIMASAQIQRKFFDFQLGVTTQNDVCNYCKTHNLRYEISDGTVFVYDISFGGNQWPCAGFYFYERKLYTVAFLNSYRYNPQKLVDISYTNLKQSLIKKYGKYQIKNESDSVQFTDNVVQLSLSREYRSGDRITDLRYMYLPLVNKLLKTSEDQL